MRVVNGAQMQNAVAHIADYASRLKFNDLPDIVVLRARQVVLDTLGTMLGGYPTRLGKLAADYAAQMHSGEEATIVGDGRRSTVEGAAWANAVMGKYLGMDDSHRMAGHVAAELVPVLLALGEQVGMSGQQLIVALSVGYDVFIPIQTAVSSWQRERGLDHKSHVGTMASAVSAAVALGLSEAKIAQSLSLAMDMASGTEQYVYDAGKCDTKDLLAGYAARNGVYAAKLAGFGFEGPPGALDGPYGYFHAFGPGYSPTVLQTIGTKFALTETGFKPHAGCRHVHSCVDATQELLMRSPLNLDTITSIEIGTYKKAITPEFRVNYQPETVGQAGFSLPVTVSVVLTRGGWYREDIETFETPEARRLRGLVRVYLDEAIEAEFPRKNGCVVRIATSDGMKYEGRVDYAKGEPENMLSDAEFEAKFRKLVGNQLHPGQVEKLIDSISRLEKLCDVGELVRLTVPAQIMGKAKSPNVQQL